MTLGGLGSRGRKDSAEVKEKRAKAHIGLKRSDKSKELMSIAKKGKPSSRVGYTHSEETREKIKLAKLNKQQSVDTVAKRVATQKVNFLNKYGAILQLDPVSKKVVKEWCLTPAETAKEIGIDTSYFLKCLKNTDKTALGFNWAYKYSGQ